MKNIFRIALIAVAYLVSFILGASSGIIHPACYAYAGAILPLLFAPIYLYSNTIIRSFGAAALLNGFILILFLATGEADLTYIIATVILTSLAEIIRRLGGYDSIKGTRWSFIPFAFSFFAYTAHWWTATDDALAAAVEEMPAGYDQLMIPVISNIPVLIGVLALTIPVAIIAMRLAERVLKKQASALK
ncbi:MAG: MptD family putative ECF transporter S component [Bacteroidales bacterium]|nr:MptD family putative ECF transporter S component [Bacteroidales bacterium]